ncbi:MAG: hypothetical protein NC341_11565 [Blautia sp.]|nr:hypothetical protein [Blautia sp.]MCM1201695.1 hypothetical protein [Bacteroides fragilis]
MGNVYAVDAQKNLIIYSTGNDICLRTSVGENLTRPIILCNDYASSLSDIVYNNTIYYVYQNINQDIILRSVIERNDLYKISSRSTPDCFYPQIAAIQNTLILFYFVKNPVDNSYCLKTLLPLQQEQKLILPKTLFSSKETPVSGEAVFASLPALSILPAGAALLVYLSHDTEKFIFTIDESLRCDKLMPEHSIPLKELAQYKEESRKSHETLSLAQTELDESKELLTKAQAQISKLQSDISARDQLIQSIRRQYEELMDTATKYREEAVKWHNKFYGK